MAEISGRMASYLKPPVLAYALLLWTVVFFKNSIFIQLILKGLLFETVYITEFVLNLT